MDFDIKNITEVMDNIEYGVLDSFGKNITDDPKAFDEENYYLLAPAELLERKVGVCFDQVELERELFLQAKCEIKTYFICTYDNENMPAHTFLVFKRNKKYYWFEHSWGVYKGLHEYSTIYDLLIDVKEKFIKFNSYVKNSDYTFVYEYEKPSYGLSTNQVYKYMETQKLIKLNKPLYFYHLIDKDADVSKGICSLQYMYDNNMYDLFDKSALKYKDRITNYWNIDKYKGRDTLSREEYIDALNIFRDKYGSRYIYFFKYPPDIRLGPRMAEILKYKDIYRININDEDVMKHIKDIFYGYNMSSSDNYLLDRKYYENISKEDYFAPYDDSLEMNFSRLNHIAIAFDNDKCDFRFLEKCT